MGDHAKLSASASHRWMECTPSAELEATFPESNSVYADEGSAAHALSEYKLKRFLKINAGKKPVSEYDSQELEDYTDIYVSFACERIAEVRARTKDAVVLIEQKIDFSKFVPDGFGTADLVIVADGNMEVCDLKYGRGVPVFADHNPQMQLYALGAYELFEGLYDIQNVRMSIFQPRIDNVSTFEMTVDELMDWAEQKLIPKAVMASKGEGEFKPGEHCRFCRAKATCRARAQMNLELAKYDFTDPELLLDEEMGEILSKAEQLQSWASDVWEYAQTEAIAGRKKWPGFKVVEGRSNRKYGNEEKAAEILLAHGYTEKQIYNRKLLGIGEMEKLTGKKRFEELLKEFIAKPAGKPALVPESDKRKAWNPAAADFD